LLTGLVGIVNGLVGSFWGANGLKVGIFVGIGFNVGVMLGFGVGEGLANKDAQLLFKQPKAHSLKNGALY
jgi:hypothetical protein